MGEVSFVPTEADYVGAAKDAFLCSLRGRPARRRLLILMLMFGLAGGAFGWMDGGARDALIKFVLVAMGGGLYLALIYAVCYLRVPRRARRLYRQQKTHGAPVHYGWSEAGVAIEGAQSRARLDWTDLHQWTDGRTAILLYHNELLYQYLPRRVLTPEAVGDLREMLRRAGVRRA
jgi:hypothetical protein